MSRRRRVAPLARVSNTIVMAAACAVLGCASAGAPPGGPERHTPPELLSISPDSGATNVNIKEVTFNFDEVTANRPAANGASGLDQLFLVSPRDGEPNVSWHRDRITVKARKGFRANTAYRVTMLPGVADLRGNVRKDGMTILFSTGSTFPPFSILGRVFDWTLGKPANGAYIEAVSHPDTNLVYVAATDSLGEFDVGPLAAGTYTVRGLIDANSNHRLDRNEKWDTTTVTVTDVRPVIELDAIERDSLPPFFDNITVDDSVTLHVQFDKALDPRLKLDSSVVTLQKSDSSHLSIASVQWASISDRARAVRDSARRADSLRTAKPDTSRRPVAPAPAPLPSGVRPGPPPPKPRAPAPDRGIVITVAPTTPFLPLNTYRITARGFRNLVGNARDVTRTFTVPKPAPPKPPVDTTKARRDSVAKAAAAHRPPGSS